MRGPPASPMGLRVTRGDTVDHTGSPPAQALLLELRSYSVVVTEDWERLPASLQSELSSCGEDDLLARLIAHGLLTEYQAARISAGRPEELILGNYRILDRIGAGGMGVVFRAEHLDLRAPVAVKLLSHSQSQDPALSSASSRRCGPSPSCSTPTSSPPWTRESGSARTPVPRPCGIS